MAGRRCADLCVCRLVQVSGVMLSLRSSLHSLKKAVFASNEEIYAPAVSDDPLPSMPICVLRCHCADISLRVQLARFKTLCQSEAILDEFIGTDFVSLS